MAHESGAPQESEEKAKDQLGLERLIFFSDAVFAIAITLLALDIRLPELASTAGDDDMLSALLSIGPQYFGFFLSFAVIGLIWMGHHRLYRYVRGYDQPLVLLNLLQLMLVAFLPFPTRLIGNYHNRVVAILYALTLAATGLVGAAIWLYINRSRWLLDPAVRRKRSLLDLFAIPLVFVTSAVVALWSVDLAWVIWWVMLVVSIAEAAAESTRLSKVAAAKGVSCPAGGGEQT